MRILHSKKLIFISKPRCGSTSLRRFLDSKMEAGDEYSDYGDESPGLHPHMSAPAVKAYLEDCNVDHSKYEIFTIIRHPIEMLWSYYNYFKPDIDSNYSFSTNYKKNNLATFEHWLEFGHVGIGLWKKYCPEYISENDFSPLSLEAHDRDRENASHINMVFKLENLNECNTWLNAKFGNNVSIASLNGSNSSNRPVLPERIVNKISRNFPTESQIYNLNEQRSK